MNTTTKLIPVLLVWTAIAGVCEAQADTSPPPMQDAATHEDLAKARSGMREMDPMEALPRVKAIDASANAHLSKSRDLVSSSAVLCNLGMATLVPKGALIYVPTRFENRLKLQPGAQIRTFLDFSRFNRTWIRTFEVTQAQAEGLQKIDEEIFKKEKALGQVIVATFHGGAISVLPSKEEADGSIQTK